MRVLASLFLAAGCAAGTAVHSPPVRPQAEALAVAGHVRTAPAIFKSSLRARLEEQSHQQDEQDVQDCERQGRAVLSVPVDRFRCGLLPNLLAAGGGRPRTGYVGAGLQALFPVTGDLSTGLGLDVNYTHNVAERFSVELSLGWVSYDVTRSPLDGRLTATTLGAVAQVGWPFGATRWYAGGGLAWWMNDLSAPGVDAYDSLAGLIVAGADIPLSGHANLCLEFRYVISSAGLSAGNDLNLSAFVVRANYVFRF